MDHYKKLVKVLVKRPAVVAVAREVFGSSFVNDSRLYGQLCKFLAKRLHEKRPFGSLKLNIETTLSCNAKCLMCSKTSQPKQKGWMTQELFEKLAREAKALGVEKAILSIYGEPLLDPRFVERARLLSDLGIRLSFFSNGSLLTRELAEELLEVENLQRIYFSINGFSKKGYEEVMVGLSRETTYSNVLQFLEMKNASRPDLDVTITCVLMDRNRHETEDLRSFWEGQEGIDYVYFPVIRSRAGTPLDIQIGNKDVQFSPLEKRSHKKLPCKYLWEDIFIYWNGDVGVCCEDISSRRIIIGNVGNESLGEIWSGKAMNALRRMHVEGDRALHKICGQSCTYNTVWLKP